MPQTSEVRKSLLYRLCQVPCRVLTSTLFDLKVSGLEHVPATGGVLLLSNHQSYLDPVLVAVRLGRPVSFLAKSELFEPWGLRWIIRNLGAFPIRQGAGDVGALRETIAKLKDGHVLNAYPEGTRTTDGAIQPFQNGIALVIRRVDVPIVPVAITGSHRAWPRGRPLFHPAPIRVRYGPPVAVAGLKPNEIVQRVESAIHRLFDELRQQERDA